MFGAQETLYKPENRRGSLPGIQVTNCLSFVVDSNDSNLGETVMVWADPAANSQVCNRSHWHDNGSRYGAEAESMGVAGLGNGFDQESTNSWVR